MAYNIRKQVGLSIRNIIFIVIILILLLIIKNSFSSLQSLSQGKNVVSELNQELSDAQKERAYLVERLQYIQSDKFIEEEAREKLGLAKEGEYIVIAPSGEKKVEEEDVKVKNQNPNWKKWWELFF